MRETSLKSALSLAVLAAAGMALNFLVQWYVLVFFGPGVESDALFAGMAIPQFVVLLTIGPLGNTIVPLLSVARDNVSRRDAAWTLFAVVTVLFGLLAAVLIATARWWVPLLVPGFRAADRALVVELSQIQLLGVVFTAQYGVVWATAQSRRWFVKTEVGLLAAYLGSFGLLVALVSEYGIVGAAWVNAARPLVQTLALIVAMGRPRAPRWSDPLLKEAFRRIRPLVLGSLYFKSDILVDRFLSSMAAAGGLSLFFLGRQIYNAGNGILTKALVGPVVPALAEAAKAHRWTEFRDLYRRRATLVGVLILGAYAVLVVAGTPLLELLVGYGGVSSKNVETLHAVMLGLGGVAIGSVGQVLSSSFYALGDTVTPTRASVVGYTLGLAFKTGGFYWGGLVGLAVGTSLYYALNLVLLVVFLERKVTCTVARH